MTDPLSDLSVLATDLDGTLLRSDGSVGAATRTELAAAARRGVRTVFVTGRPPRWMPPVVAATGHAGVAVCANGAVIVDLVEDVVTSSSTIPAPLVQHTIGVLAELLGDGVMFAVEQALPGPMSQASLHPEPGFAPAAVAEPISRSLLAGVPGVVKLLARTPGDPADTAEVAAAAAVALGDAVTVTHASRVHQMLEISPAGVDKAHALARVVGEWGVDAAAVAAVGDMPNDIPMLRWAARGFAVASAHRSLLAIADEVVPDPDHDGVAEILARLRR